MVQFTFAVLALAAAAPVALAKGPARLTARQTQTLSGDGLDQVQGLMDLATNVANDMANGNATTACTDWVNALQACSPDGSTANATSVAVCACGSNVVSQLTSCAPAYGSTGVSEASGFSTFCSSTLASLVGSTSASASGSVTATSATSATSAASASKAATSSASKSSTSQLGTAAAAGSSASPSTTKSSAGRNLAVSGLSVGLVSVVAALFL